MRRIIGIAGLWAIFLCWFARYAMLDDALIHLRYAAVLHDHHFISYDGIHPTYGASSLLYVGILALLRSFTHSPLLPKAVSLVAYTGLLAVVAWIARVNRLALALFFVLVSPFAVRWLTDGMETGLACLLAVTLPILLHRKAPPAALAILALTLSLLRVDLTLLVAFAVLLTLSRHEFRRAAALCLGSGLSLAFILIVMGHLLPDTALAKESGPTFAVLGVTVREIAATLSFGLGVVFLWVFSAVLAWRVDRRSSLICNLPFPVLVFLAALRGQQIHGVRYLIWALLFSIVWNLLITADLPSVRPIFITAFACALAACWVYELPIALRIDRGRAGTLATMENAHLDQLHGLGLAADVGYIGYFSGAPICDMNGLINGRAAAVMDYAARSQACVAANPTFLFITEQQLGFLDAAFQTHSQTDWLTCGSVDFTNVGSTDRHWLLVRRTEYPQGCPSHL